MTTAAVLMSWVSSRPTWQNRRLLSPQRLHQTAKKRKPPRQQKGKPQLQQEGKPPRQKGKEADSIAKRPAVASIAKRPAAASIAKRPAAALGCEELDIEAWAKDFVGNFARKPEGNDRAQIMAVANGEADIAVALSLIHI